jgi:hypothetical protein
MRIAPNSMFVIVVPADAIVVTQTTSSRQFAHPEIRADVIYNAQSFGVVVAVWVVEGCCSGGIKAIDQQVHQHSMCKFAFYFDGHTNSCWTPDCRHTKQQQLTECSVAQQ